MHQMSLTIQISSYSGVLNDESHSLVCNLLAQMTASNHTVTTVGPCAKDFSTCPRLERSYGCEIKFSSSEINLLLNKL